MLLRKRSKLIQGVGVNDSDYSVVEYETVDGKRKIIWICPFYQTWKSMLERCYSDKLQSKRPTYKGCSVCDDWLVFSNFKTWMGSQDWQGKHLDKDLLKEGNKIYSPDNCIFVPQLVNMFTLDSGNARGEYMIGVCWDKGTGKFRSMCNNPFTGKLEHLGRFTNELEAHLTWKKRKHELACQLAESEYCNDPRLAEALKTRYDYCPFPDEVEVIYD